MESEVVDKFVEEYKAIRPLYCDFTDRMKNLVSDILKLGEFEYLTIEARTKSEPSLKDKMESGEHEVRTLVDITDLSGIRIIGFVKNDIQAVENRLKELFVIEEAEDTQDRLGIDKVGYSSHHLIVSLPETRTNLPEYSRFIKLKAEIQIRTVLQHAWAQIDHNQIYKPSATLPDKIQRSFKLLAGVLELADNEFARILSESAAYQKEVSTKAESGDLDVNIDSISLRAYLATKFGHLANVRQRFGPDDNSSESAIQDLKLMGIEKLSQLDKILSSRIIDAVQLEPSINYLGIIRTILVGHNPDQYFKNAWNMRWGTNGTNVEKYKRLGIDIVSYMDKYRKS